MIASEIGLSIFHYDSFYYKATALFDQFDFIAIYERLREPIIEPLIQFAHFDDGLQAVQAVQVVLRFVQEGRGQGELLGQPDRDRWGRHQGRHSLF